MRDLKYSEIIRHYPESDAVLVIAPADFAVGFLAQPIIASEGRLFLLDAPEDPQPRRPPDLHIQIPPELALRYLEERITGPIAVTGDWMRLWSHPAADETLSGPSSRDGLHPLEVAAHVRSVLRPDDVIVLEGGEFGQWVRTDTAALDQALTASMSTKVPVCLNVHIRSLRSPAVEV